MAAKKKSSAKISRKASSKKSSAKKSPVKKSSSKKLSSKKPSSKKASSKKVSSLDVNLGHVFALKPRVGTSFRQPDFRTAKHRLQDETYASIEEAARAVAEKALGLTHDGPLKQGRKQRR